MNLIRVRPSIRSNRRPSILSTDFDRIFNDFFKDDFVAPGTTNGIRQFRPAVNVTESADDYRIEVAAPGLNKTDFTVKVEKEVLYVSVKREVEAVEGEKVTKREFGNFEFNRNFQLSDAIDQSGITANYENGILAIQLPKKEEAKELPPKTIEIG